jgi:hypothetical protein
MSTLTIRKKSLKTWLHTDSILGDFIISKFYFNADNVSFQIVEQGQSKRVIYDITDISLYPLPSGGTAETFTTITQLSLRLEELNYPAFQYDGQITSIANLIDAGTGVIITGDGTEANPYVISATGGGSQNLQQVTDEGNETTNAIRFNTLGSISEIGADDLIGNFYFKNLDTSNFKQSLGTPNHTEDRQAQFQDKDGVVAYIDDIGYKIKTSSFSAEPYFAYATNGTITVTDFSAGANEGYIVHVIGGTTTIGGVGYTAGALVYRFYNGSSWISTNMNNAITIDATPTDGSANAVSSNGVFDALATKADKSSTPNIVIRNITPSTALTGTTIETQITSFNFTIPANTFSATDLLKVETIAWEKSGTANASTCRIKLSNTNNYAGASNVLILAASANNINMRGTRTYKIAGGNLKGFMSSSANGIFNDNTLTNVAVSTLALDVTQPIYGFVSLTNSSSADSTIMNELIISKW